MSRPSRLTFSRFCQSALSILIAVTAGCSSLPKQTGTEVEASKKTVVFEKDIRPILEKSCVHCHNGDPVTGRLNLQNRDLAFRHPEAQFIVPGHPEKSRILSKIELGDNDPGAMPPTGHALSEKQIALLNAWIKQGANWPSGEKGEVKPSSDMDWRSH